MPLKRAMTDMTASLPRLRSTPEEFDILLRTDRNTEHPGIVTVRYDELRGGVVCLFVKGWTDVYEVEFDSAKYLWSLVDETDVLLCAAMPGRMRVVFHFGTRRNAVSFLRVVYKHNEDKDKGTLLA